MTAVSGGGDAGGANADDDALAALTSVNAAVAREVLAVDYDWPIAWYETLAVVSVAVVLALGALMAFERYCSEAARRKWAKAVLRRQFVSAAAGGTLTVDAFHDTYLRACHPDTLLDALMALARRGDSARFTYVFRAGAQRPWGLSQAANLHIALHTIVQTVASPFVGDGGPLAVSPEAAAATADAASQRRGPPPPLTRHYADGRHGTRVLAVPTRTAARDVQWRAALHIVEDVIALVHSVPQLQSTTAWLALVAYGEEWVCDALQAAGLSVRDVCRCVVAYVPLVTCGRSDAWYIRESDVNAQYSEPTDAPPHKPGALWRAQLALQFAPHPRARVFPATGKPFDAHDASWRASCAPLIRRFVVDGVRLLTQIDTAAGGGGPGAHVRRELEVADQPALEQLLHGGEALCGNAWLADRLHRAWRSAGVRAWYYGRYLPGVCGSVVDAAARSAAGSADDERRGRWGYGDFGLSTRAATFSADPPARALAAHDPACTALPYFLGDAQRLRAMCDAAWAPSVTDVLHVQRLTMPWASPTKLLVPAGEYGGVIGNSADAAAETADADSDEQRLVVQPLSPSAPHPLDALAASASASSPASASPAVLFGLPLHLHVCDWYDVSTANGNRAVFEFVDVLRFDTEQVRVVRRSVELISEWSARSRGSVKLDYVLLYIHSPHATARDDNDGGKSADGGAPRDWCEARGMLSGELQALHAYGGQSYHYAVDLCSVASCRAAIRAILGRRPFAFCFA